MPFHALQLGCCAPGVQPSWMVLQVTCKMQVYDVAYACKKQVTCLKFVHEQCKRITFLDGGLQVDMSDC